MFGICREHKKNMLRLFSFLGVMHGTHNEEELKEEKENDATRTTSM